MESRELVTYLQANPGATPARLSEHLGVSIRSVRSYVTRANTLMRGFSRIELVRGHGYHVIVDDREKFDAWVSRPSVRARNGLPQTPQERVAYLLNDLLSRNDWITLDDLSEIVCVSRSALSSDIKNVERALNGYGLALARRPHYGIRVEGSEIARRTCLAAVMMGDEVTDSSFPCAEEGVAAASRRYVLESIARNVDHAVSQHDFQINAAAYQNLLVHIAVALARIRSGNYVPMLQNDIDKVVDSREWKVAQDIADAIARETEVELPREEVAYIAIHLAGKQALKAPSDVEPNSVVSDEVWETVTAVLERVWELFRFDFRSDLELRMNLALHITPLMVRLRYHMSLSNPMLAEIKARYMLAWSMATEASEILAERCGERPSEDETGYLALLFALSLERQKGAPAKKNLLLVCASGAGSARLLEWRCRREFGDCVDRIVTCDVLHVDDVDLSDIDYVFTTVPLGRTLPVPVREVTYFFSETEAEDMRELLRSPSRTIGSLTQIFDDRLFFPHCLERTKRGVINFLCAQVRQIHVVSDDFEKLVFAREEASPTSYGNNVAMPHPLEPVGGETFVAVALFDEPVVWDERGTTVRSVFLIVFSRFAGRELSDVLSMLAELFMDEHAIAELVEQQDWETLACLVSGLR